MRLLALNTALNLRCARNGAWQEIERDIGITGAGLSTEMGTHFVRPVVGTLMTSDDQLIASDDLLIASLMAASLMASRWLL